MDSVPVYGGENLNMGLYNTMPMRNGGAGVARVCFVFSMHHPYPVNTDFHPRSGDPEECSFDRDGRDRFLQLVAGAYLPAFEILQTWRDRGVPCSMSCSGTTVEQLERWAPEAYDLFRDCIAAGRTELIAGTYYQSVVGLFSDQDEFLEQVGMHLGLMETLGGEKPRIFDSAGVPLSPVMAASLRTTGMRGAYIEGRGATSAGMDPGFVYRYAGLPVLVKHCPLSDDITERLHHPGWDRYPLTPDTFAGWIASSPGDCIHLSIDLAAFRTRGGREHTLQEFMRSLPEALADHGITPTTPSVVVDALADTPGSADETWGDASSIWEKNMFQQSALDALECAGRWLPDKRIWRRLSATDHFHAMTMHSGGCGRAYRQVSQQEAFDSFTAFMRALSHLEEASLPAAASKDAARTLRSIPPEAAFHFSSKERSAGYSAYSLQELSDMLEFAPEEAIAYHRERDDFARWISDVIGDTRLGAIARDCTNRDELRTAIQNRIRESWDRLR
ncbi:alpha-amylase [Methanoculleus taiwanensis]